MNHQTTNTTNNLPSFIRHVAILGSGTMGAQIAGHCLNAGLSVSLYDIGQEQLQNAQKLLTALQPAPIGFTNVLEAVQSINYQTYDETGLNHLKNADLIIEAVAEKAEIKHSVYQTIAPFLKQGAILASNTSGLSITELSQGLFDDIKTKIDFCGIHFFNPPRYLSLVEVILINENLALKNRLHQFLSEKLGKTVIFAKDTPNFIANRIGVFSILATLHHAHELNIPYEIVDDLTGKKLGRAKSATLRTADVVGLDVLCSVIRTLQRIEPTQDSFSSHYEIPAVLTQLVENKALGQKTGAGFYRKNPKNPKVIEVLRGNGNYEASTGKADPIINRMLSLPWKEKLVVLQNAKHQQAQFLWCILRDVFHYSAIHGLNISHQLSDVDWAIRLGFGWKEGIFEIWHQAGWEQLYQMIETDRLAGKTLSNQAMPDVEILKTAFQTLTPHYQSNVNFNVNSNIDFKIPLILKGQETPHGWGYLNTDKKIDLVPNAHIIFQNKSICLWHTVAKPNILIISNTNRNHAINPEVLAGYQQAVKMAETSFDALVLFNPVGDFSVGADLKAVLPVVLAGKVADLEPFVASFQDTAQALLHSKVPVIGAVKGLALGGGCEMVLHCHKRVAHLESYIGLVEVGVGLIPAGGGLKEMARRASIQAKQLGNNYLDVLKPIFMNIAMAKVSKSAYEAKELGYLSQDDIIVLNDSDLLATALKQAELLAPHFVPVQKTNVSVAGRDVIATFKASLLNMLVGKQISAHDELLAMGIATALCGGDVASGSVVSQEWLLHLERSFFMKMLQHPKSQERLMGMLDTGKPVRN